MAGRAGLQLLDLWHTPHRGHKPVTSCQLTAPGVLTTSDAARLKVSGSSSSRCTGGGGGLKMPACHCLPCPPAVEKSKSPSKLLISIPPSHPNVFFMTVFSPPCPASVTVWAFSNLPPGGGGGLPTHHVCGFRDSRTACPPPLPVLSSRAQPPRRERSLPTAVGLGRRPWPGPGGSRRTSGRGSGRTGRRG